jgi:hypothetical protein
MEKGDKGDVDAIAATLTFGNGFAERERLRRTANPQGGGQGRNNL